MAFLGDLLVRLGVDTADFQSDLGKAAGSLQRTFGAIGRGGGVAALTGIGAAATAAGAAFAVYAQGVITATAKLDDMAEQTGASVEALSRIQIAARIGGHDFEGVSGALGIMVKNLKSSDESSQKASSALAFLNIKAKDSAGRFRDTGDILEEVAQKLAKYEDGGNKVALVQDLLGKGGARYLSLLKDMAEDGERVTKVTAEQAAQAEIFEKNLKRIGLAAEETKRAFVIGRLPSLVSLTEEFMSLTKAGFSFVGALNQMVRARLGLENGTGRAIDQLTDIEEKLNKLREANMNSARFPGRLAEQASNYREINRLLAVRNALISTMGNNLRGLVEDANGNLVDERSIRGKSALTYQSPKDDKKAAREAAAELKKYESAAQGLAKQLFSMNQEGQETLLRYELEKGSLQKLTLAHRTHLFALAIELDELKTANTMREQTLIGTKALLEMEEKAKDVLQDYNIATREGNEQRTFELSLIGKTTREQEMLNAIRQVDLDLRKQIAALPAVDADGNVDAAALEAQLKAADKRRTQLRADISERQSLERDWATGAAKAFQDYSDAAMNAAKNAEFFFTNAFEKMEDALVEFSTTGKLDFKKLANSIIADLARIQIRANITGPFAEAMKNNGGSWSGWLTSFLSGGSGAAGNLGATGGTYASEFAGGLTPMASGTNYVPSTGPYMLHQGEAVIPAAQNQQGGGATVVQHNTFTVSGAVDRRSQAQIASAAGSGVQRALARNT